MVDYRITDATYIPAQYRVTFAASDAVQPLYGCQVLIPLHPGLELWDRVAVPGKWACWAEQKRFVVGVETFYDTRDGRGRFDQIVHLMRHVK